MKIVISSGHGKYIRGAADILDEVDEARRVVDRVAEILAGEGFDVITYHDDVSTTQNENLNRIVDFHNSRGPHDLDVSVHFNAYQHTSKPMGTECLYVTQETLAGEIAEGIAEVTGLPDRGPKYRSDLFFLNNTAEPSILIEVCFVDSTEDAAAYRDCFENICNVIASVLGDIDIDPPSPPEPEPEPEPPPPPPLTSDNRVIIDATAQGNVSIIVNGQLLHGTVRGMDAVLFKIAMEGDVVLTVNGQDYHGEGGGIPANQTGIIATVFGGEGDYNTSAYDPCVVLDDDSLYVALPDRLEGERPNVRVINPATGVAVVATIEDVGPWNTDDPYWTTGTRPQAESGTDMSGRKTNGAGIDLSPELARRLGVEGKGVVDWEFA